MLPRVSLNFGNLNRSNSLIRNLKNLSVLKNYFCPYIDTTSQKRFGQTTAIENIFSEKIVSQIRITLKTKDKFTDKNRNFNFNFPLFNLAIRRIWTFRFRENYKGCNFFFRESARRKKLI